MNLKPGMKVLVIVLRDTTADEDEAQQLGHSRKICSGTITATRGLLFDVLTSENETRTFSAADRNIMIEIK